MTIFHNYFTRLLHYWIDNKDIFIIFIPLLVGTHILKDFETDRPGVTILKGLWHLIKVVIIGATPFI